MAKTKVQYEYHMHCLSEILYEYLASADGLKNWFADDVIERGDDFYFIWGDHEEKATLIRYKPESFVRFRWEEDEGTKYFFELAIIVDELTEDLSLNITDFAEPGDEEENRLYWENLIENLKLKLGAS